MCVYVTTYCTVQVLHEATVHCTLHSTCTYTLYSTCTCTYIYMYIQVYEKLIFILDYMYYTMLFSNSIFRDYFWEQHYSSDEMDGLENIEDGDDKLSEFSLPEQVEELIEKGKYKNVERIVKQVRNTCIHPVHVHVFLSTLYM